MIRENLQSKQSSVEAAFTGNRLYFWRNPLKFFIFRYLPAVNKAGTAEPTRVNGLRVNRFPCIQYIFWSKVYCVTLLSEKEQFFEDISRIRLTRKVINCVSFIFSIERAIYSAAFLMLLVTLAVF